MSRHKSSAWILALSLALGGRGAAADEELKLVVGSWCPFECTAQDDADGLPGFLTDIAVAVLGEHARTEVVYAPYRRGIRMVLENQAQVLVGIPKEDAPELVYPDLEQGLSSNTFFVRAGSRWRYRGPGSLRELQLIGIVKDFGYDELDPVIARSPAKFDAIAAVLNEQRFGARRNIEKLLAGRVDAIVHDAFVTQFELRKLGKVGQAVPAGSLDELQRVYIAFSPRLPGAARYAALMSRGTAALRASGELARILDRYGLRDWRQSP